MDRKNDKSKNVFKSLKAQLTLKRTLLANKSIEDISVILNNGEPKEFKLKKVSDWRFKCLANFSLGTLIMNNNPGAVDGIKIYIDLDYEKEEKTTIVLKTHLRVELYFVLLIWMIIAVISIVNPEEMPFWVHLIFPPILVWFWFVYRIQENSLMKKVEKHVKNVLQHRV